ncbi:MAG: DUF4159 domain-containing protein [Planctomycetota bacterium]|nr:MAG: DUF4159 domain-containing protein [Planctomycetota bacterium]
MRSFLASCGLVFFALVFMASDGADQGRSAAAGMSGDDSIAAANLIYAGTRSSVCFSDRFLSVAAQRSTINAARRFQAVRLADEEVYEFPFAMMTGEGSFSLTEIERENLRRYLKRGGFLLTSAGCSSRDWDTSFRRELRLIFPEYSLETIAADHEIFRTVFTIQNLETRLGNTTLEGLRIGDKIVLVHSKDGLNDTGTMHGCCCCGGAEIRNAQQVNVNILAYALMQ